MESDIREDVVQTSDYLFRPFYAENGERGQKYFQRLNETPSEKSRCFYESRMYLSQDSLRRRRSRTNFSNWQLSRLESTFQSHHYPDVKLCQKLINELGLSGPTIQVWFQNRRAKWRRQENTRRGPGRPSSSAPRASCSGEPLSREEIIRKILRKNSRKKQTTHQNASTFPVAPTDESTRKRSREVRDVPPWRTNIVDVQDFSRNQMRSYFWTDPDQLTTSTGAKTPAGGYLPFNIENLLSTR